MSNMDTIEENVAHADLVVGAVLIPGAKAPKLITRKTVSHMTPGSVLVDVAVDQGGCSETCKPTSHESPTYFVDGVVHYCVTNMPGAVARTSTYALTNVTLRYVLDIAGLGPEKAAREKPAIAKGFNTHHGDLVHEPVAQAHGIRYTVLKT
jgi:alanine dehydrogenase